MTEELIRTRQSRTEAQQFVGDFFALRQALSTNGVHLTSSWHPDGQYPFPHLFYGCQLELIGRMTAIRGTVRGKE